VDHDPATLDLGADALGLLQWLEATAPDLRYGTQVELLAEAFAVAPEPPLLLA
jgi:hypothetical protein